MNFEEEKKNLTAEENLMKEQNSDLYQGLIEQNQSLVDQQNQYLDKWEETQNKINQDNLNFTQQQIEQQKQEAVENLNKEIKSSQESYQKFINPYGVEAEQQQTTGLANQGYSESSKAMAYNTTQNRISSAKTSTNKIIADFNMQFTQAKLDSNAKMAEMALTVLQSKLDNNLKAFEYSSGMKIQENQLETQIDDKYYARLQEILNREATEKARQEAIKQWEAEFAYKKEQDRIAQQNWEREYALASAPRYSSGGSYSGTSYDTNSGGTYIETPYFKGNMSASQQQALGKYGAYNTTSSNGVKYQPKGVIYQGNDYGSLKSTGKTAGQMFGKNAVNSSGVNIANQKVWTTGNQNWIWNGSTMSYEPV